MENPYIYMRIDDWITTHAYGKLDSRNKMSVHVLQEQENEVSSYFAYAKGKRKT